MNNNHYQLLLFCIEQDNNKLWNKIKKQCDKNGIKIDLSNSNLRGFNLCNFNFRCVNLSYSNLRCVNLSNSNLRGSNLYGSDLSGSNLNCIDLRGTNLSNSNLSSSNLRNSNLSSSILRGSNLQSTNLNNVNLNGTNLSNINLNSSNLKYIKLFVYKFEIIMIKDQIQIGYERHSVKEWKDFTDEEINGMHRITSEWWNKNKIDILNMYSNFVNFDV